MGVTYNPKEVEETMNSILKFCEENSIDVLFYSDNDLDPDEVVEVSYETLIEIGLPETEHYNELDVKTFSEMIETAKISRLVDECKLLSPQKNIVFINCETPVMNYVDWSGFKLRQNWNGKQIKVQVVDDLTSFSIKLTMDGLYDRYTPPLDNQDLFIEITSEDDLTPQEVDDIVASFIFECAVSHDINFFVHPRQTSLQLWDLSEGILDEANLKLRPLINGKGITDVLNIFNACNHIFDSEYRILNYTKVIEFVSQTVIRKEMIENITKKLFSPKSLNPDAEYIIELEKLFNEYRNFQKDHLAIKVTVGTCCEIMDIVSLAPKHLSRTKKLTANSSKEERMSALEELASSISDTRNKIAHAKTNYTKKGMECPEDELIEFAECLKIVASQAIRWFARQHEDSRIV